MFDRVKKNPQPTQQPVSQPQTPRMTLTVPEVAAELHVSKPTAYKIVKEPGFPAFCIGRRVLVDRQGFAEWMRAHWAHPDDAAA